MHSCAHKDPYSSSMPTSVEGSDEKQKPKDIYPEVTIRGKAAKELLKAVKTGHEFTAPIKVRVIETRDKDEKHAKPYDNPGASVTLEVISLGDPDEVTEDAKEESAEEAIEKYRSSKK